MSIVAAHLSSLPAGLLLVLAVIALAELALDVVALVDLYRRPVDQVVLGNKWIWVAIILLVNLVGAILYLAIGHKPAPVAEHAGPVDRHPGGMASAVDSLYGKEDGSSDS